MSALQPIIDWAGDVFWENNVHTTTYKGFQSVPMRDRQDYYTMTKAPFEVTVTENTRTLNPTAIFAGILVVLVFVTVATAIKSIFRR